MKECIEREKVIDIAHGYCHTIDGRCCGPDDVVELYEELKAIPAADVVEVVRCGECMHRDKVTGWCADVQDYISNTNWFCAGGERNGGAEDGNS